MAVQHGERGDAPGIAAGAGRSRLHNQRKPVFRHRMPHETEHRGSALGLPEQPFEQSGIRVDGRRMELVQPLCPFETGLIRIVRLKIRKLLILLLF